MNFIDQCKFVTHYEPYPLVLMLFDCFEPSRAALVVEVAGEYDEQVCGLVWRFAAETARERLSMN